MAFSRSFALSFRLIVFPNQIIRPSFASCQSGQRFWVDGLDRLVVLKTKLLCTSLVGDGGLIDWVSYEKGVMSGEGLKIKSFFYLLLDYFNASLRFSFLFHSKAPTLLLSFAFSL